MKKQRCLNLRHLFVGMTFCLTSLGGQADDLSSSERQFDRALGALKSNNVADFLEISADLKDYPLYYYLQYKYLQPRLKRVDSWEIKSFLKQYGDSYFGESLRREWLKKLAKAGNWETFARFYTPQKSANLQCDYVQARLMTGRDTHEALSDAKELWLVGKSQSKKCDPAFEQLYRRGLIDDDLLWERIGLVMKKGRIGLASALAKRLDPADRAWFARWKIMHKKPAQTIAIFEEPDLPIARKILLHGIKRLARKKFEEANDYWKSFQRRYAFSIQQIGEMQRDLALTSVKHKHPKALKWLTAVNKDYLNDKVSKTRFKLALRQQNWQAVADFMTELSEKEQNRLKWRYWLARALEQTGKFAIAQRIYRALAKERDYYGFIAADHIGATHQMQHRSIEYTQAEANHLMRKISIAGAREFYNLSKRPNSKSEWLLNARREWHYATTRLPRNQQAITAALAHRWGWHDRALMTAAKAGYYDDLDVRFPLAFYEPLAAAAESQALDLSWVYGIVRQESAYMSNVRSRAGALGLMQLMPATGRLVAKRIGIKLKRTRDILDINTNVSLGTAFLRQMLDKFDGNYMLATAAYNAGPGRAKRWAAENRCMPADIWVELIPFNETRKYVRRVLFYTRIFESRLGQKPLPIRIALKQDNSCPVNYSQRKEKKPKFPG